MVVIILISFFESLGTNPVFRQILIAEKISRKYSFKKNSLPSNSNRTAWFNVVTADRDLKQN